MSYRFPVSQNENNRKPDRTGPKKWKGRIRINPPEWLQNNVNVNAHITHLFIYYIYMRAVKVVGKENREENTVL